MTTSCADITRPALITNMNKFFLRLLGCCALASGIALAGGPLDATDPAINALLDSGDYDRELCATAQRINLNAEADDYVTNTLVASGTTFLNEQMDAESATNTVTVATLIETVTINRKVLAVNAACKLVNQDRVNDVLKLDLPSPPGTCRDTNLLTYEIALTRLSESQRERYLSEGIPLRFDTDYKAVAGGEWLPSVVSDFIKAVYEDDQLAYINVQATSVQVPWPAEGNGAWYQGTHHCKVITLAAMSRWMKQGAFDGSTELFPRPRPECLEPDSRTSTAGSCLLYLGPAEAQFCQDYSGSGWNETTAREDCTIRHPSQAAWNEGSDNYTGIGGIYNTASCADRGAVEESRNEPVNIPDSIYAGTCVFRCNTADEVLWHQLSPMATDPDGNMLERTCDLFLKLDW